MFEFINDVNYLIDKGICFSIEDVHRHIENRDVLGWLEDEFPFGTENGLDFSLFKENHRNYIHDELISIHNGYVGRERRKWGIENNGLCLLISWSLSSIGNLYANNGNDSDWYELIE